jgi:autotransporter-associated beta strand protein
MKYLRAFRRSLGTLMVLLMLSWQIGQPLQAATFYWDADTDATGNDTSGPNLGGTGIWNTSLLNWWDGIAGSDQLWNNTNDTAVFGGPTGGAVALDAGGIMAGALQFKTPGYTLSGGPLSLSTGTITADLGTYSTIASELHGTNGLTLSGTNSSGRGAVKLTNAGNSYTGTTTINSGTLIITAGGALGTDTSTVVINEVQAPGLAGGSLMLAGNTGASTYGTGFTVSRNLSMNGVDSVVQTSPPIGTAILSVGNNTISGLLTSVPAATGAHAGVTSSFGMLTLPNISIGGVAATNFTTFGSTGSIGSYNINGTLAGTGSLQKAGFGTLILAPTDATGFSGTVQVSAGSVRVTDVAALGTSTLSNAIELNGGTFELRADPIAFGSAKKINLNNGGGADLYLDHVIGGTGVNQTFTFANYDYLGGEALVINSRNGYGVTFTAATALGNSNTTVAVTNNGNGLVTYGGTLWGQTSTSANSLTISGTGNTLLTGSITATGGLDTFIKSGTGTVEVRGVAGTYLGATTISGGALVITDFRTLNAQTTGTNTAAINLGTTTTAGILTIGTTTASTAAGLTLLTGKSINLNGTTGGATINANQTFAAPVIIGSMTVTGSGIKALTLGGTSTQNNIISGVIIDNGGATSLVKADTGTWVLGGSNTYTGTTTITGGTLKINANAATTSTVVGEAAGNTVVFNANAVTLTAAGTLEFVGFSGSATTETLGALTPTAGAGTVKLTANAVSPSATNLVFTSLGATTGASSVNFNTSGASGGVVKLTGQAATTATTLPGTANFQGHLYINGANFAAIDGSANVITPVYGTTTGFVNAASALTASSHNLLTGSFTSAAATISSLKATTQTLTLSGNLTVNLGAILQTGGTATIQSDSATAWTIVGSVAAVNIAIRVDGTNDVLNLGALGAPVNISGTTTGGLTKNGAGTLIINGINAQTGATTINEGTVRLGDNSARLSGANAVLVIRQGAILDLNGQSSGVAIGALDGAGTITNSNATAATLIVGNVTTGVGIFSGIIQDGTGVMNVSVTGTSGTPTWSGLNTYTGVTTIGTTLGTTKLVNVPILANYGTASSIGKGVQTTVSDASNAASLVFGGSGGTEGIAYTGTTSVIIDRLFTLNGTGISGGGQIANNSANNSTLIINGVATAANNVLFFGASATASQTLTLGGSSTGDNLFNIKIVDNGLLKTNLSKAGAGLWILGNAGNSYTGTTIIAGTGATAATAGYLQAIDGSTLPTASGLILGGTTTGGVLVTSGNFTRTLVASASAGSNTVSWATGLTTGASGFSASDSKLVVALGGLASPTALTWNSGGFMGTAATTTAALQLSSIYSLAEVEFRNAIDLNGANRTIQVDDNTNTFTDFATITGVISNSAGTGGIIKTGVGMLQLLADNTYNGSTAVTAGMLVVTSLGNSATSGVATSVGTSTGANLIGHGVILGNATTTGGTLVYVGAGETSDRYIGFTGTTAVGLSIVADGSGALVLTNVNNNTAVSPTGAKTLSLRGLNNFANTLSSILANDGGGGVLTVTHDTAGTWILSGANTYTGTTTASGAGTLGAGNDQAFGLGGLTITNATIFASGGDRNIANPITLGNTTNAIDAYVGDYSLTFSGTVTNITTSASSRFTRNNLVAGNTLTFNGAYTFTGAVTGTTWNFDGSGDTILNGLISQASAGAASTNVMGIRYAGTGSLTLGNTGNAYLGATTISSGTMKVGVSEVIPDGVTTGAATTTAPSTASTTITAPTTGLYPGMTISGPGIVGTPTIASITSATAFVASAAQTVANGAALSFSIGRGAVVLNPAAGATATLDLNGESETINGLTANSAGNAVIDNSSPSVASFTFGANDQPATIAPALGGTFTIGNSGGGALSVTKTGAASVTIPSTGVTLSYTGATSVTGGTLTIAAPLNGTNALSATGTGSNLNLTGGLTVPDSITSVTVGGGAFLSLLDGTGTPLSHVDILNLGAGSGIATLSLELGTLSDTITVNADAVVANTIRLNLSGISGLMDTTDYSVLVANSGLSTGTYVLGSQPGGFSSGFLTVTDSLVKYTTGSAIVGDLYWNNTQVTGSWATNNSGATNFTTDLAGTTDGTFTPGPGTTVIFGTTALTGGPAFTTTLDANFTVAGLQFTANPPGVTSWAINAGSPATSNLTLKGSGISVANNAGAVTINASVILGAAQSWDVNGLGTNGSSLTIASIISGNGFALSKTGAGTLNLSGINTFNGGLTIKAGTVIGTVTASVFGAGPITLGDTSGSNSATLQVNTTALTYANAIALAAGGTGTLTIGTPVNAAAIAATFSGGVTGTNNLTINNQSLSGTTIFSINALDNAGTITNASSSTGTVTISGGIGSNVTGVVLNSITSALTISTGALNVNLGGTTLQNVLGTKILTVSSAVQGTGNLILKNDSVLTSGVTVSGPLNNIGTITNNGTGVNATAGVTISGIIGTNVTGLIQDSLNSSLQLTGVNTFTSGIAIKKGILEAATSAAALGAAGNVITLGDTSGNSSASLRFQTSLVPYNDTPVNVVAGSSGTLSILGSRTTGINTFPGAITLAHDLTIGAGDAGATTAALTLSGGVTGTGNLDINYSATALTGAVTFSTNPLNMVGTITNRGNSTATTVISGGIGANVTAVTQNSTTSALTISTTALTVNSVATTLTNTAGTKILTLSGGTTGTGSLILNNNSALAAGITVSTLSVNHTGTITNSGSGAGDSTISSVIGTNVTGVIQNSATSQLILSGANTFTGGITVKSGIVRFATLGTSVGGSGNTMTLGNTSGSDAATLQFQTSVTYDPVPITVAAGSSGTLTISGSTTTGAPVITGAVTLNNNLTVGNTITGVTTGTLTLQGGMTGTGNLTISSAATSAGVITFSTNPVNIVGSITNSSVGATGAVTFSSVIGPAVTSITQNSATSSLTLSGANTAFTGTVNLTAGTLNIRDANALGATGSGGLFTISAGTLNNNLTATPLVNLANNALKIDGNFTFTGTSSLNLGTGAVSLGTSAGTTRTITTTASTLTLGGVISNGTTANSLIKAGAGTLALSGASTFTGGVTVNAGTLQFSTVSNNGGAASSLGQGTDGIILNGGTLGFIGSASQVTNRAVTLTAATNTLSADGTGGATITYSGAFLATTVADVALVLTGSGDGFITSTSFVPSLGTGDLTKTGTGTWTISGTGSKITDDDVLVNAGTLILIGSPKGVDDDVIADGNGTILNLNTTGVLVGISGTSNGLYLRNGAVVNINADDPYSTATGLDYIILGDNLGTGTLNTNTFNITTPRLDLGQDGAGFIGSVTGSGSVTVGTSINLFQGTIASTVSLVGAGSLYKLGGGTVTLSGVLTGLTGTTGLEIHSGILNLDYTTNNAVKFRSTASLIMSGGALLLSGNASSDLFEKVAGITLTAGSTSGTYPTLTGGSSVITLASVGAQQIALSLGDITHTVGGSTIRFNLPTGTQNATNGFITTQPNTNGIIGGYATVNDGSGASFATNSGGNIIGVSMTAQDAVASWLTAQNITDSSGFTGTLVTNTNITSLRFNAAGPSTVTINAGVVLNLSSGGILQTSNVTGGVSTIAGGRLTSGAGNELIFNVDSTTQRLEVTSQITGTSLVTKGGVGTLRLNSANNFYSGTTSVLGGTLQVSGGGAIGDNSTLIIGGGQTSTLELLANETVGSLSVGGENGSTAGAGVVSSINLNGNTLVFNQGAAVTMAGVLFTSTSAGVLVKSGSASWTNQASNPGFLGTFRVDQGLAVFSGNVSQLSVVAAVILNGSGSSLRLDADQTTANNRILNTATLTLNNTAGITANALGFYQRRNGGTNTGNETVGQLILGAGHNTIASDATASATSVSTITFSNATPLVRNNLATLFVVGRALGDIAVAQRGNITFSVDPGGAIGGAGAAASSTITIYPYVVGESTLGAPDGSVNFGNSFVQFVSTAAGFKPLDLTTEYVLNQTAYDALGAGVLTNNVRFTATTTTLANDTAGINSLVLDSAAGITVSGPAQTLAITSGAILSASAGVNVIAGFSGITTGANPYYVYVTNPAGSLTLTAPLTTGQPLVKSGAGTLIMNSTNNAFTDLYFNQGVVQAGALNQLGLAGASNFNFFGGTLQFTGVFDPSSSKTITFGTGGGTLDTNGNDITLANAAAATSIGMNGAGGLIKTGSGNLTLAAQAAYAGSTAIQNGTIILASGANDRLPTTTALVLGSGASAGSLQLGNGTGASNQTVGELSLSGSAGGSNAIVGGDTAVSVLTVNQGTQTTYSGSIGGVGPNQNNMGITKSGIGSLTLSGSILSYVGPTSVTAGDLNITGSTGALLATSAVNVNAGATLNLLNGVGQIINLGSGALSLGGGSGTAVLGLELGSTSFYDHITTTGMATTANLVLFNLTNLAGFGAGNYDLLSATGGGLSSATYALGAAALGGVSLNLNTSDTLVQLAVTAITGDLYWQGAVSSGWTAFNGMNSNFTTDLAGTLNAQGIPGTNNGVIFSASSQTNTTLNTALNANFFIRDLTFNNNLGSGPLDTISIGEGSGGTLTITPTVSTAGINIQAGAAATISISAPIILGASQTWTVTDAATVLATSGGITGTGNLIKAGNGMLTLTGTNSYIGTTTVNAGVLRAGSAGSLNSTSAFTIGANGTLRLNGFAATLISLAGVTGSVLENGVASGNVVLTVGDSTSTTFAGTLQNGGTATLGLTKIGTGALTLSGASTFTGNTTVSNGILNITGSWTGNAASSMLAYGGSAANTVVNVSGDMTLLGTTGGNVSGAVAVYNQTAGNVTVTGNITTAVYVAGAAGSYGYFNLTGGTYKDANRFALAVTGNIATQATAVVYVGGTGFLDLRNSEWMLNYSHAQLTVADSGVVDRSGATQPFGLIMNSTTAGGVYGVLNVAGGSFLTTTQPIKFGNSTTAGAGNNNSAFINLAAGTLQVGTVMTISLPTASANNAYLNFAGGTLKTSAGITNWIPASTTTLAFTSTMFGAINNSAVAGAPSFNGGLTFDTNGFNSSFNTPFVAAAGAGVTQADMVVTGGSGYSGAPEVIFSSTGVITGGTPAAGYALISGGVVTGIVITSPGTYASGSTPGVTLTGGGGTGASVTLGALITSNVSGGLTKIGAGTLTLSGANTYTGGTFINDGTLALGASNVLADGGNVTTNGGIFNISTFNDSVATVTLQSGSIIGTTGVLTSTAAYELQSGSVSAILAGSVGVNKSTSGTATLSAVNTYTGAVNVTGGTLAFSTGSNLGSGVSGNTVTVNGGTLSYTAATSIDLGSNRVLTVGAGGATLNVSNSVGVLNFSAGVSGASNGGLTKTGAGTVVLSGTTNLNGGAVSVNNGTLRASFGTGGISALTIGATGVMDFSTGSTQALAGLTGLTLNGGARLGFELDTLSNDSLAAINAATTSGTITLDFSAIGSGLSATTYNLISAASGLSGASYILGAGISGWNLVINSTDTLISLTATPFVPVYWRGGQNFSWNTLGAAAANWTTDAAGLVDATQTPQANNTVIFSAAGAPFSSGTQITTTLDAVFTIDSLVFNNVPATVTGVTINPGTGGTLALVPVSSSAGIEVKDNAGTIIIAAPLTVGAVAGAPSQTWNVSNIAASLVISGNAVFTDTVNKTGAGALTLSGSNSGAGGVILSAGTLNINSTTALGTGAFTIAAGSTINNSSPGAITLAGNNVQTWNGSFTFTGTQSLNLGTGAVTMPNHTTITVNGQTLTVGGVISEGTSNRVLTKAGAGTLVLGGNNTFGGGFTLLGGTLNLNNAGALGAGVFTIEAGTTLDNITGSPLALFANNTQVWNGSYTFTGSSNLDLGSGTVTLGSNITVTTGAGSLNVRGVIDDGLSTFGLTKAGAGTLSLGSSNTYGGTTVLNQGNLVFTANQNLTAGTNTLTLGELPGSTSAFTMDLSTASATFGGAALVQTSNSVPNTISIGAGQTLGLGGSFTVGYNSATNTTTNLSIMGADGTFSIGAPGVPTNANVQIGNGSTTKISNAGILDLSGLGTFYANLGTGTFRVGSTINTDGTAAAGSTVYLAANSTIIATTITSDSPDTSAVTQAIKLGSGTNVFDATTITIGGAANRARGTLDFTGATGTIQIRNLAGTGRAAMNVQNGAASTTGSLFGTVDFTGHNADLLLGTLTIGGRSAGTTGSGTGVFSFDTGILDATLINLAARTGVTMTTGSLTGTLTLGGGTVTVGTVTMSTNSVNFNTATGSGDATSTINISGAGTNTITTMTMGTLAVTNTTALSSGNSDATATVNVSGGTTTISTLTMGANNSAATTVTANTATSALNISGGAVSVTSNLTMAQTTLRASNTATATISITGGSLTVGGNILYTDGLGTENNTVTLNGGLLDMTVGSIGTSLALISFNAQSGTLRNLSELNGGGTLTKTTSGTLIFDTANGYTGATAISAGILAISSGGALGGAANGTSVAAGGTLSLSGDITVTSETLSLTAGAGGNAALNNQSGNNAWTGSLTVDTGSDASNRALLNSDAGKLTVSGNVALSGSQDFVLRGDGNGEISGQITGSQRLFKSSVGTGTWILSGNNSSTFTGKTTVGNGALQIASESNLGATPGSFVANQLTLGSGSTNGRLKTTGTTSLSANRGVTLAAGGGTFETAASTTLTVNSVITGSGPLTKEGAGTLIFTGVNTNTGATTVNAGALGGTGAVGGDLTVASGGTLAPGIAAGQFTVTGNLSVSTGGALLMQLGGVTTNDAAAVSSYYNAHGGSLAGLTVKPEYENYVVNTTAHDSILVNGAAVPVINGTLKLDTLIGGYTPGYGDIFDLLDWTSAGNITGVTPSTFDFTSVSLGAGLDWNTDLFASNGILVVVPEPSRMLFLMLGLLGLMIRRRRSVR